jgi:hypothetical protein
MLNYKDGLKIRKMKYENGVSNFIFLILNEKRG